MNELFKKEPTINDITTAVIGVSENAFFHFVGVPNGYSVTKIEMEGFRHQKTGKLKSLNSVKSLAHLRKNGQDLVSFFTKKLKDLKWDFDMFPNPIVIFYLKNN